MLCNILLLDFQVTKVCNACVFYLHIVIKCIRALDISHNAQISAPNKCSISWIRWLLVGNTGTKNLPWESLINIHWLLWNFLFLLLVVTFLPLQYENLDVFFEGGISILDNMNLGYGCSFSIIINGNWKILGEASRLILPFRKFLPFSGSNQKLATN